jgi:hypothetical protein
MTVTTFGDSIIISWKIEEGIPPEYVLPVVAIRIENAIFWDYNIIYYYVGQFPLENT